MSFKYQLVSWMSNNMQHRNSCFPHELNDHNDHVCEHEFNSCCCWYSMRQEKKVIWAYNFQASSIHKSFLSRGLVYKLEIHKLLFDECVWTMNGLYDMLLSEFPFYKVRYNWIVSLTSFMVLCFIIYANFLKELN